MDRARGDRSLDTKSWSVQVGNLLLDYLRTSILGEDIVVQAVRFSHYSLIVLFRYNGVDAQFGIHLPGGLTVTGDYFDNASDGYVGKAAEADPESLALDLLMLISEPFSQREDCFRDPKWDVLWLRLGKENVAPDTLAI